MAETPSTMIPLGTRAPEFNLLDTVSGQEMSLQATAGEIATVVMFICNHCPYVKHIVPKLLEVVHRYQAQGISFVAINSNDAIHYPADNPENMRKEALDKKFPFPYLFDETQAIARAYHASCTPDFFVFDKHLACVYRGRFDGATPGNQTPVTGEDLCAALDNLLAEQPITREQKPSLGCNIKWKK